MLLLCDAHPAAAQSKQLGPKLVGTGNVGNAFQGFSVALSGDGNTAIVGGLSDAWVFTRSDSHWIQQRPKLGTGSVVGAVKQGVSAALSASGRIAVVGKWTGNS